MPILSSQSRFDFIKALKTLAISLMIALGLALGATGGEAYAKDGASEVGRETGLPVPRFVSLKRGSVNLRVGPGRKYQIAWQYRRRGLPVEVIQEFDQWRRIRDSQGATGWVLHSLLSSRRTAIIAPWDAEAAANGGAQMVKASLLDGKRSASASSSTIAKPQAGLQVDVEECNGGWCQVQAQGISFWMRQPDLWGVYPDETIED